MTFSFGESIDSQIYSRTQIKDPIEKVSQNSDTIQPPQNNNASRALHNYCIAIRGNGELMPAHWGALAQAVENFGIPKGMAGGSSGTISTFLMESFMMNPLFKDSQLSLKERAVYLAFIIKSMEGFVTFYTDQDKFQHFFETIKLIVNIDNTEDGIGKKLINFIEKNPNPQKLYLIFKDVKQLLSEIQNSKVFYGEQVERFSKSYDAINSRTLLLDKLVKSINTLSSSNLSLSDSDQKLVTTFESEYTKLKDSLAIFGTLNAKDDKGLFYRGGIVNFKELANIFGIIADFYSLSNTSNTTLGEFKKLLSNCAFKTSGMSWAQIESINPECKKSLNLSIESYLNDLAIMKQKKKPIELIPKRLHDLVGENFKTLISTSVIQGQDVITKLLKYQIEYNSKSSDELNDPNYLESLTQLPVRDQNLKFGYWGNKNDLVKIENYIVSHQIGINKDVLTTIDKSKRFLSLGEATWQDVLSLSPAEPGLSPLLPFKTLDNTSYISLGGWSDLHPIPVLKFMGCENVVYITRQGGEAYFAQGVSKRILGFPEIDWKDLDSSLKTPGNRTPLYNNQGRGPENDLVYNSQWSKMYNLANPNSSFNLSVNAADAIICTRWDSFDIKKDFRKMIDDAYHAPIYNHSNLNFLGLKPAYDLRWVTPENNTLSTNIIEGFEIPRFSGCVPSVNNKSENY